MSASNRAAVVNLIDGVNSHDLSVMRRFLSNSTYHFPLVGDLRGEALLRFVDSLLVAFPDLQRNVEDQVTDGAQHVVVRWRMTGTHQGAFLGIPPTGKTFSISGISIYLISGGTIREEWHEWDSLSMMQQLGVIPRIKLEMAA